jgi:hypothetical protein
VAYYAGTALLLIRLFKPFLGAGCFRRRPRWIELRGGTGVPCCAAPAAITQRSRVACELLIRLRLIFRGLTLAAVACVLVVKNNGSPQPASVRP